MQPIPETSPRFSNLQLELLRLYSRNLPEEELLKIKDLLADFFAERAIAGANAWWDANNWTEEDVQRMLTTKMRAGKTEENATLRYVIDTNVLPSACRISHHYIGFTAISGQALTNCA